MRTASIRQLFMRLAQANPEPATELRYQTPYQLLVAVILSAQATDASVNRATAPLFRLAPTAEAILALGEDRLAEHIRTIGLFRTKARNIITMTRRLLAENAGQVPADRQALEDLPGVGRKTANVVLNIVFQQPTIAVDTHIFRVANRTGLAAGKDVATVEAKLLKCVPAEFRLHAHHWLILHGRYVCKARKPECHRCLICDLCAFPEKAPAQ